MSPRAKQSAATAPPEPATEYLDERSQKALANRLARLEGHVRAVRRMVLERRCADDILLQVAACKAALNRFSAAMVEHELHACMDSCMEGERDERIDKLTTILSTILKQS